MTTSVFCDSNCIFYLVRGVRVAHDGDDEGPALDGGEEVVDVLLLEAVQEVHVEGEALGQGELESDLKIKKGIVQRISLRMAAQKGRE